MLPTLSSVPRKPREEVAGGIHHVYARGNDRGLIYRDDHDRHAYLFLLGRVVARQEWRCLAYCLMDNHVHLLLETPKPNLGEGMQRLHGDYARLYNKSHDRVGHVFQGRYGAVRITSDRQLWTTAGYIARNPVEAGLCADPEDWAWSSFAAAARGGQPNWLDSARLRRYLRAFAGDASGRCAA